MMLTVLVESALRSLLLGSVVWVGLNLLRVRNPHVHMICWVMVLVASLSMPLLMQWATVTVTLEALPIPAAENLWPVGNPLPEALGVSSPTQLGMPVAARGVTSVAVNWWALATAIYAGVAGLLLLRLALGIHLTWRLVRAAKPIDEPWTANWRVRVSHAIGGPVTFGSTILLPPQCIDWNMSKRQAVLAHEEAHVANRDFYVLLLASLNRAVFWFSPFAWWQLVRLAELAEIISDASRFSRTGCVTPRSCSIWCSTSGRRRRVWKWQGRARYAAVSNASSRQPQTLRGWAGANDSGPRQSSCRSLPRPPAPSPTALRRCPRAERRRRWRASPNASPSIHWAEHRSLRSFAKATISSDNSAGSESSDCRSRVMEHIPTRRVPVRSPWPSAMSDSPPS
jgi:beta-lactamase regulating signal transducer with metallopeptidase domain